MWQALDFTYNLYLNEIHLLKSSLMLLSYKCPWPGGQEKWVQKRAMIILPQCIKRFFFSPWKKDPRPPLHFYLNVVFWDNCAIGLIFPNLIWGHNKTSNKTVIWDFRFSPLSSRLTASHHQYLLSIYSVLGTIEHTENIVPALEELTF